MLFLAHFYCSRFLPIGGNLYYYFVLLLMCSTYIGVSFRTLDLGMVDRVVHRLRNHSIK
jgi:hypothetical protein